MTVNILGALQESAAHRAERWYTVECDRLPPINTIKEKTLLGKFSRTGLETKTRQVDINELLPLGEDLRETPPAIARDYLKAKYRRARRAKKEQLEFVTEDLPDAPNIAIPGDYGPGYYIDIKSAFWQILLIAGWNVDYWPDKFLGPGTPPDDFPFPKSKIARNSLVSAGLISKIPLYDPHPSANKDREDGGHFQTLSAGNPLANRTLYRLIMDVLNCVAFEVYHGAGAVYVNTDGYIVGEKQAPLALEIIASWGLFAVVKADGLVEIQGAGAYRVGKVQSALIRAGTAKGQPLEKVWDLEYREWLKRRFLYLCHLRMSDFDYSIIESEAILGESRNPQPKPPEKVIQ